MICSMRCDRNNKIIMDRSSFYSQFLKMIHYQYSEEYIDDQDIDDKSIIREHFKGVDKNVIENLLRLYVINNHPIVSTTATYFVNIYNILSKSIKIMKRNCDNEIYCINEVIEHDMFGIDKDNINLATLTFKLVDKFHKKISKKSFKVIDESTKKTTELYVDLVILALDNIYLDIWNKKIYQNDHEIILKLIMIIIHVKEFSIRTRSKSKIKITQPGYLKAFVSKVQTFYYKMMIYVFAKLLDTDILKRINMFFINGYKMINEKEWRMEYLDY